MKKTVIAFVLSLALVATPAFASTFTPSAVCSNDPSTTLNWHVDNATSTDQAFSWERLPGLESGSNVALATTGVDFTTGSSASTTPDTLEFTWNDGTATSTIDVAADTTPCPAPAPAPAPSTGGSAVAAMSSGGHATDAQMRPLFSASNYLIFLHYRYGNHIPASAL